MPAHWIVEERLPGARQTFLTLRQLAARYSITISAGELLLVKACSPAEQGDGATGAAQADGVCPGLPLEDFAEALARFVLVQDAERGVFAEIHCLCGEEGGALTALPVVDVLTHPGVRAWLFAQREARWQEMTRFIVSWGLLGF